MSTTRSYSQLCGIATALDLVGDRWALLVVRELVFGPQRFNDLADGLPGIGTNTLSVRLKQLEAAGVVRRHLLPLPERGTAYELTDYGGELRPILLALGRWGARSMNPGSSNLTARSRWLLAAMLAFHTDSRPIGTPTTWELRLDHGTFTVVADGPALDINTGAPDRADAVVTVADATLHRLLTRQITPGEAVADGSVTLAGDVATLDLLVDRFDFPTL
ncbi:MAG TPA: winged helix-turn-helix transcriptional regulator [Micromonosporaceae bacterium]